MKHLFKTILLCITSATVAGLVTTAGCTIESAHPEAQITYEFNGGTYSVNYLLYRNVRPHTVKRFIELADNGFYDNTVVHDYKDADWVMGGYSYDESYVESANKTEYFENFSKDDAFVQLFAEKKFTASVFEDGTETPLPTVLGEFPNNINQEITNDPLKNGEIGCLKMVYYEKETTQKVYVAPTGDQIISADYKTNCATSLFAMQTGSSSAYATSTYAAFARLNGTEGYDALIDAVNEYIDDTYGSLKSDFYETVTVWTDTAESYSNKPESDKNIESEFKATNLPIIIKTVKITKY